MRHSWILVALVAATLGLALRAHLDLGDLVPRWAELLGLSTATLAALLLFRSSPSFTPVGARLLVVPLVAAATWAMFDQRPLPVWIACLMAAAVAARRSARWSTALTSTAGLLAAAWILRAGVDAFALWRLPTTGLSEAAAGLLQLLGAHSGASSHGFVFDSVRASRATLVTPELVGWPVVGIAALVILLCGVSGRAGTARLAACTLTAAGAVALGMALRVLLLVLASSYLDGQVEYTAIDTDLGPYLGVGLTFALDGLAVLGACAVLSRPIERACGGPAVTVAPATPRWLLAVPAVAGLLLALPSTADALGGPRAARVVIDEGHSEWEPTDLRLGKEVYGEESGYNFRALVDWLEQGFGPVRRNYEPIEPESLAEVDVLVLKTPTRKYTALERSAVLEFVEAGGGLFLIGDHTNVFGTGEVLNEFGQDLGFRMDFDSVFDQRQTFEHVFRPSSELRAHPILASVPMIRFEVGCSIDLESPDWRPLIVGRGMKNLQIDYKASNYYPSVKDATDMRFGQLAEFATRAYGQGRIALLSDSTLLSTFSVMYPGRRELIERTVDWLSRGDVGQTARNSARFTGLALLALALLAGALRSPGLLAIVASTAFGAGALATGIAERALFEQRDPIEFATSHRNVAFLTPSETAFWPTEQFVREYENAFSIFFQWVLRVGAYPRLESSVTEALDCSSIVVAIDPSPDLLGEVDALLDHVEAGGVVFAIQSGSNQVVGELARRAGFELGRSFSADHVLSTFGGIELGGELAGLREIRGGEPLLAARDVRDGSEHSVLSVIEYGRGRLVLGTQGGLITDHAYGRRYHSLPDQRRRRLFEVQYRMFEAALDHCQAQEERS